MAKFTQLLAEWLKDGNALPSAFSQIEGLESAFLGRFCDREIGFETPDLFKIKLESRADYIIPAYAERIRRRREALERLAHAGRTTTENRTGKYDYGEAKTATTELPFNSSTAEPNIVNRADAYTNEDATEFTRVESGLTADEATRLAEWLEADRRTMLDRCCDEFESLFMLVY